MEGLSSLLPKVYPGREPEQAQAQRLFGSWGRVAPPPVLKNARPVSFRNGCLLVHTTTGAWANALSLEHDQLKAKLLARAPGCKLRTIRFRVGVLPRDWDPPPEKPVRPPLRPVRELPDDVARELARIDDDGLRDSIARAAAMSLSRTRRGGGE